MENLRKTVVIMRVGEPSTLNACQGRTLIVFLCVVLYTSMGSPDHQLKTAEKQPATLSSVRHGTFAFMY